MKLRMPYIPVKVATYKSYIIDHKLPILVGIAIFLLLMVFVTNYIYIKKNSDNDSDNSTIDGINATTNVTVYSGSCSDCHNKSLSRSGVDTNKCNVCHMEAPHGNPRPPSTYNDMGVRKTIHLQHSSSVTNQKGCQGCHAPPACNKCHSGHISTPEFNISKNCQECHGGFPEPRGHQEQRSTFKKSVHSWMGRCNTCHKGTDLRFKNLATYNLSNSSQLCSDCHSAQYKDATHYATRNVSGNIIEDKKCVDCHNPHTGPGAETSLIEPSSLQSNIDKLVDILANNAAWVVLILLLICSIIIEYIFRPKEGNIILSKGLKVEHNKLNARSIRITSTQKLNSSMLRELTDILDNNGIELLGISAGNEETVLFISVTKDKRKDLIERVRSISGILKAEYTKDYDIR